MVRWRVRLEGFGRAWKVVPGDRAVLAVLAVRVVPVVLAGSAPVDQAVAEGQVVASAEVRAAAEEAAALVDEAAADSAVLASAGGTAGAPSAAAQTGGNSAIALGAVSRIRFVERPSLRCETQPWTPVPTR